MNQQIKALLIMLFAITSQWVQAQDVAKIGSTEYATLQAAVDAAQQLGGAQTINIIGNISGESVTIQEVANFKLTIDGQKDEGYTVDAAIVVDGLRGNGGSTTNGASVTLQNIAFVQTTTTTDGITATHYPHNLTIQDCTYSSSDNSKWFLNANTDGPLYGVTVKNVTVEHARLIYGNLADDAVFQNITATNDVTAGFNVKTSGTALIENCEVTTGKYAFRDYADTYAGTFTLKNNTFVSTTTKSDEGVIVNRGGIVGTTHINVVSGTYSGPVKVMNNKEGVLAISGGYFSEEFPTEYIATELVAQGKVCVPATDKEGFYTVGDPHYVAQIGETGYVTLQAALDAAHEMTGNVTITLLDDISGYSIVHQKAGVNITIDGDNKTVAGQIIIDGDGRASGTETLTIQNMKFEGNTTDFYSGTDAFILIPSLKTEGTPYYTNKYNYAHNITVSGCSFTSTSSAFDVVGIKATSGAGCYNVVINNATGTNLHSLAQLIGTTGASVTNCTVAQSESFVNVNGGGGTFTISGNTFTSANGADGYGIRENGTSTAVITLTDNNFTATNPVVLGKGTNVTAGTINVESGVYTGTITKTEAATGKIAISGGYFSEEFPTEYIAADLTSQGMLCVPAPDMEGYFTVGYHYVAQIGETKYKTLTEAVAAVPTDGTETTILMIADEAVVAGLTIDATKNIVLELNGKTISGNTDSSKTYALITNKGTLTIQDNTDTAGDGTGTGLITTYIANPDGGDVPGYASNTITNNGNLTVKSGKIVNNGNGYACYAIDNQTNGTSYTPTLKIEGGRMEQMNEYTYAVRMFCNSTTNTNSVEVTGGVITGGYGLWLQIPNNKACNASLNISGGTITARDGAAVYIGGNKDASHETVIQERFFLI